MKKTVIILAALAAVCACQKTASPSIEGETITLTAGAGVDETKVHFGELSQNKYPYVWDDAEVVGLDEFCSNAKSQEVASTTYTKVSANKAKFEFSLSAKTTEGTYFYAAVIPANSTKKTNHGWRSYDAGKFSYILNHTVSQTPLADGPDPTTNIMYATYEAGPAQPQSAIQLNFQPAVAYGKMTLKNMPALASGETLSAVTLTAPSTKYMRGRIYKNISTGEETFYSASTKVNDVVINPENITFSTTSFDVWFTTLPFDLANGDTLKITLTTNTQKIVSFKKKIGSAISFTAGKASAFTIDYTKRIIEEDPEGVITFPFKSTATAPAKWPTEGGGTSKVSWAGYDNLDSGLSYDNGGTATENTHRRMTANLTVKGVVYTFVLADCDKAKSHAIFWNVSKGIQANAQRYLGLPVISGKRITKIVYTQEASNKSAGGRYVGVTEEITGERTSSAPGTYVDGGKLVDNSAGTGTEYTFNITNTLDSTNKTGKQLYLTTTTQTSIFGDMKVTYEDVETK